MSKTSTKTRSKSRVQMWVQHICGSNTSVGWRSSLQMMSSVESNRDGAVLKEQQQDSVSSAPRSWWKPRTVSGGHLDRNSLCVYKDAVD